MSSLLYIKYLIFSPWEVSGKGPYNKYCTGQFYHGARQLMALLCLTEMLWMLCLGHISGGCLSRALGPRGQDLAREEVPQFANFYPMVTEWQG